MTSTDFGVASITKSFLLYRSMRLLNDLHNIMFGSICIPIVKLCAVLTVFISVAAATILRSAIGPVFFSIFLVYLCIVLFLIIPGALFMSQVYSMSKTLERNISDAIMKIPNFYYLQGRPYFTKNLKAQPVLKSKIGEFYYMESKAKLTLLDDVTRGIAFMLISFK